MPAGPDNVVRVWKPEGDPADADRSGPAQLNLEGHKGPITSLVVSPKDKKNVIYSGSADGSIRQWTLEPANLDVGKQTQEIAAGGPVAALAMRPDAAQLASVGGGNLLKLWKVENGQPWTDAANQPLPEMKGDLRAAARGCRSPADGRSAHGSIGRRQEGDHRRRGQDRRRRTKQEDDGHRPRDGPKGVGRKSRSGQEGHPRPRKRPTQLLASNRPALVKPAQDAVAPYQQVLEKNPDDAELKTAR